MLLDRETRDWVIDSVPGYRITRTRQLLGGGTNAVYSLTLRSPDGDTQSLVLKAPSPNHWSGMALGNEARALQSVAALDIPTPELVAVDEKRFRLLMTRVEGRVHLRPHTENWLIGLVELLPRVHKTPLSKVRRVWRPDKLWQPKLTPPAWSRQPKLWKRIASLARKADPLGSRAVFCHGDFHPGNILWNGVRISGLVDWSFASILPAEADVAHCRSNLVILEGLSVADEFLTKYRALTGAELPQQRYFDARDLFIFAPDPIDVWEWQKFGRPDLNRRLLRRRCEDYAESLVS